MKFLIVVQAFLTLVSATSDATCEDCQAVVTTLSSYLTSQESINRQVEILLAEVCIIDPVPEDCLEQLPGFWPKVAMVLWPGYFNPDTEWMCASEDMCGTTDTRGMTCEECLGGIKSAVDQLLSDEFVSGIMDALSGEGFCGMQENEEACIKIIHELIPYALPTLANQIDSEQTPGICNMAVPDTCPAL